MTPPDYDRTDVHVRPPWDALPFDLAEMTTSECALLLAGTDPTVIVPIGSTEPHGPHLPLATDAILARGAAHRAAAVLRTHKVSAVVAPEIAYGVTHYADGFAGAISLSPALVTALIDELARAYRTAGFRIVCLTNHHLEPAHVDAVRAGADAASKASGGVVFADQLTRRWGRTLSDEFKRGNCHAGTYETSLVLAENPALVRDEHTALPPVELSLSDAIKDGKRTFREIGIDRAYTGAPAAASAAHGEEQYAKLATMIVTEVLEALGRATGG